MRLRWIFAGLGAAALVTIGVVFAVRAAPATGPALIVLGDSLAVGLVPHLKKWAEARGMRFAADAKGGRSTRAQKVDVVTPGSTVFVSLGTNDSVGGDIDYIHGRNKERILNLVSALNRKGAARIVWLVPPATKPLPGLPIVRATIAAAPVESVTTNVPLRADGVHPSNYATAARDVVKVLG